MPIHCSNLKEAITNGDPEGMPILYARNYPAEKGAFLLPENVLLFVQEGHITFHYGEMDYTVKRQQFAFFRKGILLEYESGNTETVFFLVMLKNDKVTEFISKTPVNTAFTPPPESVIAGDPSIHLRMYFEYLRFYLQEDGTIPEGLVQIKLKELLFCISRHDPAIMQQILDTREPFRPDMTGIIEENMMDSLSLDQLARLAGRSVSTFRRDFLTVYNMPPSRWIRRRKLEKAKELLAATNMTVTNICYTLGFESIAHFSRLFKSHFGYPPSGSRMNAKPGRLEKTPAGFL